MTTKFDGFSVDELKQLYAETLVDQATTWDANMNGARLVQYRVLDREAMVYARQLAIIYPDTLTHTFAATPKDWDSMPDWVDNCNDLAEHILRGLADTGRDVSKVQNDSESGNVFINIPADYAHWFSNCLIVLNLDGQVGEVQDPHPREVYNWPTAKRYLEDNPRAVRGDEYHSGPFPVNRSTTKAIK